MDQKEKQASSASRSRALNRAVLRGVIAAYLVYLGASIVVDQIRGTASISPTLVWIFGPLFVLAGAGFGLYTWKRWKIDEKEAAAQTGPEQTGTNPPTDPGAG